MTSRRGVQEKDECSRQILRGVIKTLIIRLTLISPLDKYFVPHKIKSKLPGMSSLSKDAFDPGFQTGDFFYPLLADNRDEKYL